MAPTDIRPLTRELFLKVRVSEADHAQLQLQATANGVSVSDYVRSLIGLKPLQRKVRTDYERPRFRTPKPRRAKTELPPVPEPVAGEPAPDIDTQPATLPDEPVISLAALMGWR